MCGRGFSRLLPALYCSLHPCRQVVCSDLEKGKGKSDWRDPAPKTSLAAATPVHTSPCGPGGPACCWASLSLHGSPMLGLPWSVSSPTPPGSFFINHHVPRLPEGAAVLACQEVLHWLQRWWELPGISWMNQQGELARAGPGGVRRGTVGAVSPAALTGVSNRNNPAMLPLPAETCKKSGANHVETFSPAFFPLTPQFNYFFPLPGTSRNKGWPYSNRLCLTAGMCL